MNITPYTAKDFIYLVGAFNGWNAGTAPAMNRSLSGLKYELFVNFTGTGGNCNIRSFLPRLME